jgi:ACS family sodium-dependent inorganic phosphate cotransporter-like MFS transporter 5
LIFELSAVSTAHHFILAGLISNSYITLSPYIRLIPIQDASEESQGPLFAWDEKTQSLILGSFFWGYIATQIPGGRLAERFGAKCLFGSAVAGASLATLATPLVATSFGYAALMGLRVFIGICLGVTFPSMHVMIAKWALPRERSKFSAFIYAGMPTFTRSYYALHKTIF